MGTCRHAQHSFHAASKLSSRQTQGFVSPTISFLNFLAYQARLTSIFVCGICSSLLQGVVFFLFLNETASTILTFVGTHQQLLLSKPGSLASLSLPKTFLIALFHADITLFGVNVFLIYRYYRLTKRWWIA
ncbi:hypothetical protein P389DRAFT_38882 [Cystobasidium minutum MCA 4210]|uniref:uncharacterized protein n=1 Tax=Cystobasidium minutum MCA 4210 TaxID=1397322 RepID=UPI0034CD0A41|eukprot:jgi/Rhomi1/38882/CE38881_71